MEILQFDYAGTEYTQTLTVKEEPGKGMKSFNIRNPYVSSASLRIGI
jgi:hypothetical protein